jgi:hypothetical protein
MKNNWMYGTYVAVVELPEALPSKTWCIAESFLDDGVQEAEQEIDTGFFDGGLAGSDIQ